MRAEDSGSFTDAAVAAARWLSQGGAGCPVMLLPTLGEAQLARMAAAEVGAAFGVRFETFSTWARSDWELLGDGREVCGGTTRELLLGEALRRFGGTRKLPPERSAVPLLASLIESGVARAARERRDAGELAEGMLAPAEEEALAVLDVYGELLAEHGLVDEADAIAALAFDPRAASRAALVGFAGLTAAEHAAAEAMDARGEAREFRPGFSSPACPERRASELNLLLERLYGTSASAPVDPAGAVRFLLPAGDYAAPGLIAAELAEAASAHGCDERPFAVVAAKDPLALFSRLAPWFSGEGAPSIAVEAQVPFASTAFGSAFLSLLSFATPERFSAAAASDFALSALSGLAPRCAADLDARWRGRRPLSRDEVVCDLAKCSSYLSELMAMVGDGRLVEALVAARARVLADGSLSDIDKAYALAAAAAAEGFLGRCAALLGSAAALLEPGALSLLGALPVAAGSSQGCDDPESADVLVCSLAVAARRPPCSCSLLVVADMSAEAYPVKPSDDPVSHLASKLGVGCGSQDALGEARRTMFRALETARDAVVLERPRNDADASESYPCVQWEEIADAYRPLGWTLDAEEREAREDDKGTKLPRCLGAFVREAGEESFTASFFGEADEGALPRSFPEGGGDDGRVSRAFLPARVAYPVPPDTPILSASAIEAYLDCPLKWFLTGRLRLDGPDAEFGAREKGSFAHAVLKATFEELAERGVAKLEAARVAEAKRILDEAFSRQLAEQPNLPPDDNPLIPLTVIEEHEVEDLRRNLLGYLEREPRILPSFSPRYFELPFGQDEPVPYAGVLVRGRIDRIDVDAEGRAVVIDYKGSAGKDHALAADTKDAEDGTLRTDLLPRKVQGLIYAQVVQRTLGLQTVGALYVPYGKVGADGPFACGAFDHRAIGERDVPGAKASDCAVSGELAERFGVDGFAGLVDAVEERIAAALVRLRAGDVRADPARKSACSWCPNASCPRRN